jgi:hypothetical protein
MPKPVTSLDPKSRAGEFCFAPLKYDEGIDLTLAIFVPLGIFVLLYGIVYLTLFLLKTYHRLKRRRAPFTDRFLRGPGQSLIEKLDDINDDISAYIASLINLPFMLYSLFISELYYKKQPYSAASTTPYVIFGILVVGFILFKLVRFYNLRKITRLGYEGEVATGQELNQMMLKGYHVYHDFVADHFNIDHIVVGRAGVFAVETKARSKPLSTNKSTGAKVIYDGKHLQFPKWKEAEPLEQAKRQALWLERWLQLATGEKTPVRPVLALPGWFVERTSSEGISVINPKQFKNIAKSVGGVILDERRITSLVHQIDQRCRNIESKAVDSLGGKTYDAIQKG